MRVGQTLREGPADAQIPSHKFLIRGAFLRQIAAGFYAWLPLGRRVLLNVERARSTLPSRTKKAAGTNSHLDRSDRSVT